MTSTVVRITGLAGRGRGVARVEGEVWLVQGALPGEEVEAEVIRTRAGIREAVTLRLVSNPHPARDPHPCPHARRCGGCDWFHVRAGEGAELKRAVAEGAARGFPDIARRLRDADITPSPLHYRLRARLHWDPGAGRLGFYRRHSWAVTPIVGCRLLGPRLAHGLGELESVLRSTAPGPVDVEWLENLDGSTAVAALRPARGGPQELPEAWLPTPGTGGPAAGWHILSRSGRRLAGWGEAAVSMVLPVPLTVPIGAFFQVNRHLVPFLFQRVAGLAGPGGLPVWDLHAGVGFLAAAVSTSGAGPLTLVEPFRPAATAAAASLPGARVFAGRTAEAYLARHHRLAPEAVVLTDPPRAGMSPRLRNQLAGWHPRRLVTMACDPATWARDASFFLSRGYDLCHVELVDLFPGTSHVEVLAVLEAV